MDGQCLKVASDEVHDPYVKLFDSNERGFNQSMIRIHELVKGSGKPNYEGLEVTVGQGYSQMRLTGTLQRSGDINQY